MRKVIGSGVVLCTVVGLGLWKADAAEIAPAAANTDCPAEIGQGNAGPCVTELQHQLNQLGTRPQLAVDGIAGVKTKQAIIRFQHTPSLRADGIAGPKTKRAILDALATPAPPIQAPPPPAPPAPAPRPEWKLERGTYVFNRTFTRQIADNPDGYKLEKSNQELVQCNIGGLLVGKLPIAGKYIELVKTDLCDHMSEWAAHDLEATAKEAAAANACLLGTTGDYAGSLQGGETFRVERGGKCWG
ncbi:peptidoglycan-binding protein [Streptomyces sp. NPDC058674]|uniref:peptidoglycan-binding domain-containing protein n=1 Tax=Streptomyces sp. NPDC058674 TaxID=3346592 RepID=UPI0036532A34